jgi:hypothetical protein
LDWSKWVKDHPTEINYNNIYYSKQIPKSF